MKCMPDVSILISARDNYSQAIVNMRNANAGFTRDISGMQQRLDALNRTKASLKLDASQMRRQIQDAQKAIRNLNGEAADTSELRRLQEEYERIQQNLNLVSREARNAQRDLEDLSRIENRGENRAGNNRRGGNGNNGGSENSGLLKSLARAGFTQMAGNALASATNSIAMSGFGSETGTMFSSVLGGATTGAAMGSLAGPVGALVGGAVGAGVGAITGATQVFDSQDQAFKSAVQEQYQSAVEGQQESLTEGSQIAAKREMDQVSFTTLFGSEEKATGFLDELKDMANTTPFLYDDLTSMSKTLKTFGYDETNILPTLTSEGNAGAALGMTTDGMNEVAKAIGRMKSSDKATLEYLNILNDRGVDAIGYIAENLGVSKGDVYDMISKGQLSGVEVSELIIQKFDELYAGAMEAQSKTYSGLESTLTGMNQEMQNAMGEGYNEERAKGMEEQIEFLQGDHGQKLQEANKYIGEYKASLENLREELQRDAWKSISEGTIYSTFSEENQKKLSELHEQFTAAEAKGDGAELGRIQMEAQIIAATEYQKSEGAQLEIESQKALVSGIRQAMVQDEVYKDFGYNMGEEFSKGMIAALQEKNPVEDYTERYSKMPSYLTGSNGGWNTEHTSGRQGKAFGMERVPYDNFPALLHEGEQVLTASQARQYKGGKGSSNITINLGGVQTEIRSREDAEAVARIIAEEVSWALRAV